MADIIISGSVKISYFTEDGGWVDFGNALDISLGVPEPQSQDSFQQQARRIIGQTFSIPFTPSPEFWGIIVRMQLQYNLRELHRNLGRYLNWPYTN